MNLHNLVVSYCGDVQLLRLFSSLDEAREGLADWCIDNWHDDDTDPEDFSTNDLIEWYFDHYDDYLYTIDSVPVPKGHTNGDEVLLTPARCRMIREALGNMEYGIAAIILAEEDEVETPDVDKEAMKVIDDLIKEFEV